METRRTGKDSVTIKLEHVSDSDVESSKSDSKTRRGFRVKEEVMDEETEQNDQFIEISTNTSKTDLSINEKSKALTKNETRGLLDLIMLHPIITSKETNATNNQQKIREWNEVTEHFNATCSVYPRTSKQLRLKWENLKKKARRRNANIRLNREKTDLNAEFIPRDEILDKVSTLLRRRRKKSSLYDADCNSDDSEIEIPVIESVTLGSTEEAPTAEVTLSPSTAAETNASHATNGLSELPPQKKKPRLDEGREARNRAIAGYYAAKTRLLEANLTNIHLQNEKLQLEIVMLKRSKNT